MADLKIWKYVGIMSAMSGLVCFPLSSTYKMSFGKLGKGCLPSYLLVCLITPCLILLAKRIQVSETVKGVVGAIFFAMTCLISVVLDNYVLGKPNAFAIISSVSFGLMSVSMSRKLELGFETGFSTLFLQLFAAQLFKIKRFLLPIAIVFCALIIILRHRSQESLIIILRRRSQESQVQEAGSIPPNNGSHPPPNSVTIDIQRQDSLRRSLLSTTNNQENIDAETSQAAMPLSPRIGQVVEGSIFEVAIQQNHEQGETPSSFSDGNHREEELLLNETAPETDRHEYLNVEGQYPPEIGEVSGESLSSTNNEQNNQEESSEATQHSPSNYGQVSEATIEETRSSFSARHHFPSNYGQMSEENISDGGEQEEDSTSSLAAGSSYSSGSNQNGYVHSSSPPQLRRRRRMRMTPAIQNIASSLEDALRRWHRTHLLFFFFFKQKPKDRVEVLTHGGRDLS